MGAASGSRIPAASPWAPTAHVSAGLPIGGVAAAFTAWRHASSPAVVSLMIFAAAMVVVAEHDLLHRAVPMRLMGVVTTTGLVGLTAAGIAVGDLAPTGRALVVAAAFACVAGLVRLAYAAGLGNDELSLMPVVGLHLGWLGSTPAVVVALLAVAGAGVTAGLVTIVHDRRGSVPGPAPFSAWFAVVAVAAVLVAG